MPVLTDEDVGLASPVLSDEEVGLAPAKAVLSDADVGIKPKSQKYLAMQAERDALAQADAGSTTAKVLEHVEGVVSKIANPVGAILELPEQAMRAAGLDMPYTAKAPLVTPEAAKSAVEFMTPGGRASEGTVTKAVQEFVAENISPMTSPEMVGLVAAGTKAPLPVGRYFQGHMLTQVPATVAAMNEAQGSDKTKAALNVAAGVAFPALIEKGIQSHSKQIILQRAKQVGPATEAAIIASEVEGKTVALKEQTKVIFNEAQARKDAEVDVLMAEAQRFELLRQEGVTKEDAAALITGNKTINEVVGGNFTVTPSFVAVPGGTGPRGHAEALMEGYNQAVNRLSEIMGVPPNQTATIRQRRIQEIIDLKKTEFETALRETVKEPTPAGTAPEPLVPLETATSETVKPAEVVQPASAEPSLPISTPKVEITQPELKGMGGAIPSEFEQSPKTATGIKNATVDVERTQRGLPPAMEASKRSFGTVWDQAMAKIDQDPGYPDRLVTELADKPRALTDLEDATLLHRQIDLQNEYGKATRDLAQAFDDGRLEDVAAEKVRVAAVSDQLLNLYNVNKAVGTETGRGLAARKMMAYEDFSLAKMELERRAAKGGEQLTDTERAEVVRLNRRIEETQKAYDDYVAKTEQQITALEVKSAMAATERKAREQLDPKTRSLAERLVGSLEKEADAARQRIKERGLVFGSGPLHELPNIRDFAIIGASHIARGSLRFSQWSADMIGEFGDKIEPYLKGIFDESNKYLDDQATAALSAAPQKKSKPIQSDKLASKLHFENAKAKAEWHEKLESERLTRRTVPQKVLGTTAEVLNTTRAIITSLDLSAVLRQGGFITFGHPIRALKAFPSMLRALRSEEGQHRVNLEITERPNYPLYQRSKLYLSEHGHTLSRMEEAYMSRWADKIPLVAGSQRAYVTFLNRLRADSFDAMAKSLTRQGEATAVETSTIANFINVATGRGTIGMKDNAAAAMNTVFFAPRYVASRFQLVAGQPLYRGSARTRKLVAMEYGRFLAGLGVVYGLAKLADGEIEQDPRSSDFGKVRFGNTRIDPLAGLQQATVLLSRLGTGETKRLSGKIVPIRGDKVPYGSGDSADVIARFLRTKLSPVVSAGVNVAAGENVVGEPVTPQSVTKDLLVPLALRDIYDTMIEQGVPHGTAIALLSIFGMGVQTYEAK